MKKRLTVILSITAVSILSAVVMFAGIAAQSSDDDSGKRSFAERVASILGLETSDVRDAFAQARDEMRDERADALFSKLVEHGKLTQEEADAIVAWKGAKPDIEFNFGEFSKREWASKGFGRERGSQVLSGERLEYLVEEGVLTQADADSLMDWYDGRPDAITKLMSGDEKQGKWGKRGGRWHDRKSRWGHKWGEWRDKGDDV